MRSGRSLTPASERFLAVLIEQANSLRSSAEVVPSCYGWDPFEHELGEKSVRPAGQTDEPHFTKSRSPGP
jgi:hypothetical protein